jgi:hypothetical protein
MIHEYVTTTWVYEHYLIYLYLCIADCDCIISDNELEEIRNKAILSIDYCRYDSIMKQVYYEFRAHTEEERREYIKQNALKYLRTESIRQRVIQNLEANVQDKSPDSEEQVMFRYIRMVINNLK